MNFADDDVLYTRIHEFHHLHPEREHRLNETIIAREYSRFSNETDEPYYPINSQHDRNRSRQYRELTNTIEGVIFGGRLGSYQYLDMHMAIASAMSAFEKNIRPAVESGVPLNKIRNRNT